MARISTYPIISTPTVDDLLIGTDVNDLNITKNFTIGEIGGLIGQDYVPYVGATGNVNLGSFNIRASAFIIPGGLASQFLKADGSLDSTAYTPQTRTLTINGTTYNLSANRSWDLNTIDTLTTTGTSGAATYIGKVLNIPVYQAQGAYITQLSGEATAVGPGNASVTLSNSAVIGKVLTGLNVTGGSVVSTDTILQAFGKVQNQINGLAGGVEYQGVWNAATNNPFLQSSVGVQGHYYVVNVAGNTNLNGITDWQVGDWAIYNGTTWDKVDNTDAVVSVNGYVGAVVLTSSDVGAVPTTRTLTINGVGYNLSLDRAWTVGDVRTDGSYANPSWITSLAWSKITGTPTTLAGYGITDGALNTRTLTINGTTYDLTANRTWSVGTVTSVGTSGPLTGGTITGSGTIGITQAGASSDGYLSSADWNSFNSKQEVISVTAPITFASGVIGITQSSSTVNGYLSSTDWTTFNNKVSGSGTANTLPMWGSASSLVNSPLSYATDTFNFQYNSATGGTVNFTNIGLTAYTYSIQMNNFGSPRSTIHSYTDGLIIQSIGGTQVSRIFANGNLILGTGAVDNGYKLEITGNLYVNSIANATIDTDRFIVSDGGLIKYRTGAEVLSDIGAGTVFSVGLSAPIGFSVSNSPVTSSGTLALSFAAGYSLPTDVSQTNWDIAYNNRIASLTTTGTSGAATFISNVLNIPQYQAQGNYITSLTGEATASGPGAASVTLVNSAVTGKVLTGLTVAGSSVVATDSILTAFGKLQGQVNDLIGGLRYEGTWNATTNTPTITSGVGNDGDFYIVSVAGTTNIDGINDWQVGDWIVFHDTAWQKVDNTESVVSVNGFVGAVTLTTSNISEGTNLYFTDGRARTAISLTTTGNSGAATYNNGTGVFNIPQYTLTGLGGVPTTRSLTINGTNFDLSADRTWSVGTVTSVAALTLGTSGTDLSSTVVNGTTTPVITLNVPTASATNRGALSSADWTTFNNKMPAITFNAPLFIASGGDVGITQAGASSNGFLSSTDWTTFNNKQNALTNPVTGTGTTNVVPKFTGTSTIGDSSISDNTNEVSITKRLFLNTGGQSFTITPNLSGVSNRIESSSLPLEITTLGSALRLAAGGVTAQLTLASTGIVTLTNLAGTGSRIVTADASGNLSASSALSGYIQGSGTTNYLPKFTGSTTVGNSQVFDNGTNVGIGTASPARKLDVNGTSAFRDFTSVFAGAGNIVSNITWLSTDSGLLNVYSGGSPTVQLNSNGVSYFNGGNVGIGTATPTWQLQVEKNTNAASTGQYPAVVVSNSNATGYTAHYLFSGATNKGGIEYSNGEDLMRVQSGGAILFNTTSSFTERMRITSGGNLLVGTTTDNGARLQVNGSVNSRAATTSASLGATTFIGAGEFISTGSLAGLFWENRSGGVTSNSNWYGWYTASGIINLYNGSSNLLSINGTTGATTLSGTPSRMLMINTTISSGAYLGLQVNGSDEFYIGKSNAIGGGNGFYDIYSNAAGGGLRFFTNGAASPQMTIASTGAATFSSSVTIEGSGSQIRSGNELRFWRADNAIYTKMFDAGSTAPNGFTFDNLNAEGFHFKNNGTTIMRMNSAGNVGIGTTSPINGGGDSKWITLDGNSYGGGFISSVGGTAKGYLYFDNGTSTFAMQAASGVGVSFLTSNTERARITSGGNVLIGTTSDAGYKLNINGNAYANTLTLGYVGLNISDYNFYSQTISGAMGILGHNVRASSSVANQVDVVNGGWYSSMIKMYYSEGITFHTSLTSYSAGAVYPMAGTERMRITSGGNVGIGTASPVNILSVFQNNASSATTLELTNTSTGANTTKSSRVLFVLSDTVGTLKETGFVQSIPNDVNAVNANLIFGTRGSDTFPTERMRINSGGFVGIETANPITRISIRNYAGARLPYINGTANAFDNQGITVASANSGNAAIGGGLDLTNNTYSVGAYSPVISFSSLGVNSAYNNSYAGIWGILGGPGGDANWVVGSLAFGTASAYGISERMRIANDGNVLIGTTSNSGDKLRVNGNTFTNEIMTWNPQNDNRSGVAWRLGAATIGTDILNRRLRVNVGGVEYYIGAVEV